MGGLARIEVVRVEVCWLCWLVHCGRGGNSGAGDDIEFIAKDCE
jgi:hypothetical protein